MAQWTLAVELPLPDRSSTALSGTQIVRLVERMPVPQREACIWNEVLQGNLPSWNRKFVDISFSQTLNASNCSVVVRVLPEYLALGSDSDYFLCPVTPVLAQRLADRLGCALPTRKIVNLIWTNASVKLDPQPIPPTPQMTTVPVFADHNLMVSQQRSQHTNTHPLGALVSGHKKDIVISSKIYTNFATAARKPVVIYGWHYPSGLPIQPLYNGHGEGYADYSHGARFVHAQVTVNGAEMHITNVLTDPILSKLLHDETASEGSTNATIAVPRYQTPDASP
jgi:hypothetical protein